MRRDPKFWAVGALGLTVVIATIGWKSKRVGPSDSSATLSISKQEVKAQIWTCPMHPQIRQDHPGQCPICGMNLVVLERGSGIEEPTNAPADRAGFHLSHDRQRMIGLKSVSATKEPLFKMIEAAGRVAFDPELYNASTEYLEAVRQSQSVRHSPIAEVQHSANRMVESARLRLKIMGLSDDQIQKLSSRGTAALLIPKPGDEIWVYAEVFEMDLPFIHPGLVAKMTGSALEGKTLEGKIASVDRVLNAQTRTAKVRIQIPKSNLHLRPGSYVNVSIHSPMGEQLSIPADSVLDTGKESWVFVTDGEDSFTPKSVTIKFRAGDRVAIADGLSEGEKIVTHANFLIDSESRLRRGW